MNRGIGKILLSAIACLGLAAEMSSNAVAAVDAQACLQSYYMKSYAKALPMCQVAALAGDDQAQFVLGVMYAEGKGVQRDVQDAARWLEAASQQGHLAARYKLQNLENSLAEEARQKQTSSFWTDHKPMLPEKKITEVKTEKLPVTEQITVKKKPLQIETFAEPKSIEISELHLPVAKRDDVELMHTRSVAVEPEVIQPTDIKIVETVPEPVFAQESSGERIVKEDFSKSWPQYEGLNSSETSEIAETLARDLADANRTDDRYLFSDPD